MRYYVDCSAKRPGMGDAAHPFQTIQAAAEIAMPGDEVLVAPGIYREYVNPKHAGTKEKAAGGGASWRLHGQGEKQRLRRLQSLYDESLRGLVCRHNHRPHGRCLPESPVDV